MRVELLVGTLISVHSSNQFTRQMIRKRKGGLPINTTVVLMIAIAVGAIFLAIVLPLLMNAQGASGCVGPFKGVASVLADMTSVNICS